MTNTTNPFGGGLRAANSLLRFLLELAALAALGVWGFHGANTFVLQLLLAIAVPLAAAVVWSIFIAPRARVVLHPAARTALEAVVFGAATLGLLDLGMPVAATVLAGLAIVNIALLNYWGQWEATRVALAHSPARA